MKEKYKEFIKWGNQRPKQIFVGMILMLTISAVVSTIIEIYFPPKSMFSNIVPNLYSKSDETKKDIQISQTQKENIMKELASYKEKVERGSLSSEDSLRIEYLYEQYKKVK